MSLKKYPTITIRLDKELKTLIERQARQQGITVSELVRQVIKAGLDNV